MNTDITKEQAEKLAGMSNDRFIDWVSGYSFPADILTVAKDAWQAAITQQAGVNAEGWRLVREAYQVLLTTPATVAATNKAEELLRLAIAAATSPQQQQADHIPDTTKMVQGDDELVKPSGRFTYREYNGSIVDGNTGKAWLTLEAAIEYAQDLEAAARQALANYRARKGEQHGS